MKRILFVCIGNSCRSQIAEGFAKHFGDEKLEIKSAGIAPATSVSGKAKQIMLEKDIDISDQYPKQLMPEDVQWADRIIIMGCDVKDPGIDPSSDKIENWSIDDPIGQTIEKYLEIRDEIEAKIIDLFTRF